MDSPVIVDAASKLGREIDLDRCSFPGFPFDDDADVFERPRSDGIRAHLDDLAARHPEFAEHLRGPPWPFSGSLLRDRRRQRRSSGGSNNDDQQQQGQQHQDEDTRSQASGSSAASGASAVSSHSGGGGEHDSTSSSAIPQYGLRNTVDIGQQQRRRDMETSPEKDERGQRSMSAPPTESWQQQQSQQPGQEQQLPPQGQRFVSRVDITPQNNQQRAQSPSKPASNVRHIPIFVEGRDVPVMPKVATDDTPSSTFQQRQSSPPSHHFDRSSPPAHHFHRPSHFNERFSRQQWPPSHFQDAFYKPSGFEQPMRRQFQSQQQPQYYYQQPQHQQQPQYHHPQYQQQQQQPQQHYEQHGTQQQQTQQPQPQPHQEQQQQQQQETPKPKPPVPKDPLERVAQVQKDVDDLAEQVQRYVGGSRQDKEYMYLDEMLTRELIKLDDIETEGRENVRLARKNAIKSIQDTISLLETKTPIANQQEQQPMHKVAQECSEKDQRGEEISHVPEPMEVDAKQEKLSSEPIPLPPVPSSPTKTKVESLESESAATAVESVNQNIILPTGQQIIEQKTDNPVIAEQPVALTDESTKCAVETSKESKPSDGKDEEQKDVLRTMENKHATSTQQTKETIEGKTEVNDGQQSSTELPRLQKKAKKTKKKEQQQQPVSEQAIPLPPPPTESAK